MTALYPILDALADGRVIRRGVEWIFRGLAWVTLAAGVLGVLAVLRVAFADALPVEATLAGLLFAAILAATTFAMFQVFQYHIRDLHALEHDRHVVIPIAAVTIRVVGEQLAVWAIGLAMGAFFLTLIAAPYVGAFLSGVSAMPFVPAGRGGGFGLLGALWALVTGLIIAGLAILVSYLLAEMIVAVADIANYTRRLATALAPASAGAARAAAPSQPVRELAETITVSRSRAERCPSCHLPVASSATFCEQCGARV